ncbi:MAG: LuxR C-terminal-related transcriptional regulator [Anaerolineae bacterium]
MKEILLTTKYQLPPLPTAGVPRPRLLEKLNSVTSRKLTLVSAPAGFGKTTLVRQWLAHAGIMVSWLALDSGDNLPGRFAAYLIQALRQSVPQLGEESLALLDASHLPGLTAVLSPLVNELAFLERDVVLVLDDYHLIDEQIIHKALDFFVAHLPHHLHVLLTSRTTPPLNLARLRSQAQLLEFDSGDLRFTAVEVEQFLRTVMNLDLPASARVALEMRTEGWIAGIQLAGLSLQSSTDPQAFLIAFSGTDRHIEDYLFEEVLRHQPDAVRHFLLHTSLVNNLCASLCDALLERTDSQAMLEQLDRLNLFIVPLDTQRHWFRYHPLFAELLLHNLTTTQASILPELRRRASRWYEHHDRLEEAIPHSLQAADYERAARLIETAFEARDWLHRDMHRLLSWFDTLPEAIAHSRPRLLLAYCWLLFEIFSDRWLHIEALLHTVERALEQDASPDANLMLAQVDLLRANRATQASDQNSVITYCRQALGRLPPDETYIRSGTLAHMAAAHKNMGHAAQANRLFAESIALCRVAENIDGLLFAAAHHIETLHLSGLLAQAEKVFSSALDDAGKRTGPDMGWLYITIADVYREQNRLIDAYDLFQRGVDMCRPFEAWQPMLLDGLIGLAQVQAAQSDIDAAVARLYETERAYPQANTASLARLAAVRARLHLARTDLRAAQRWKNSIIPSEVSEFELFTWVRVRLAEFHQRRSDRLDDVFEMLETLHKSAQANGRLGHVIEIALLHALAHNTVQNTSAALAHFDAALVLAENAGCVRLFVDEGLPVYRLLTTLRTRPLVGNASAEYIDTLRAAFPSSIRQSATERLPAFPTLTGAEFSTLRLLATERSIEDIAAELSVAVSTVRTYAKRIYSKLDAHSRAEAVFRAKELKLL